MKENKNDLEFEWDEEKNKANKLKHDVSFEQAATVFDDEYAVYAPDYEHSEYEERFIVIGLDVDTHELMVCYCYRGEDEDIIRIISARNATKQEIKNYYAQRRYYL